MMDTDLDSFSFDDKQTKQLLKKAKLMSTLRTIAIVVVVTPIIMILLWYGFRQWSHYHAQKTMNEIVAFNEISGPNVHISNQTYNSNWFGGEIETKTYKLIGKRPYIWEPVERKYNLFGSSSRKYGSFGPISVNKSESLAESSQFYRFNSYTGDRELFFYHPEIPYATYKNSVNELNKLEKATLVELGLSFDQAYSLEEIKSKLPPSVQVVWWWVDAYTDENLAFMKQGQQTVHAESVFVYGFHSEQFEPFGGMDSFISSIELLRKNSKSFKWDAEQAYESLIGDNKTLEKSDIKIIGAIVTGTAEQLNVLQGSPYIKASTFGVITNQQDSLD
ncbi:anti sigma factor C-terminal domain-containing protein [Paenibacillus sp. LHD-38]|uniref:anti sigma factor C-terminal domain-containing protein n=1 Tax=Paenibacillus sp. LHD-38 TaxID=3072143 RepID=UPI00280F89A5|nr:anti sigma factor C-terminal domain-containing protein [Paenibacillus sp. LHD-38]MDQ8739423.1 anti sigma factor C-terminal domain-containing protein [Paenibacillus sp. LHD-38]